MQGNIRNSSFLIPNMFHKALLLRTSKLYGLQMDCMGYFMHYSGYHILMVIIQYSQQKPIPQDNTGTCTCWSMVLDANQNER